MSCLLKLFCLDVGFSLMWFLNTVVSQYLLASELAKPGTHHILTRKKFSAYGACSPLITLARTCMSHVTALQEKMLPLSSLAHQGTIVYKVDSEPVRPCVAPLYDCS